MSRRRRSGVRTRTKVLLLAAIAGFVYWSWTSGEVIDRETWRWLGSLLAFVFVTVVVLMLVLALRRALAGKSKDAERLFTADQKREGHSRAGFRCEHLALGVFRCRQRTSLHGDHWFPHSLGGATSMNNFVSLCERHNLAKSNITPTPVGTWFLAHKRKGYFPSGVRRRPGEWNRKRNLHDDANAQRLAHRYRRR